MNDSKICICTIGKNENLYVREYISHYKNLGVNKIFIYDNNEINGEHFEEVIIDYISNKFVEIINFRGKIKAQLEAYQDCLNNNYNKYNWLIFYDMDEFISLKNYNTIQKYLGRNIFDKCETVQLSLLFHTDNNFLYYNNQTLNERFKETIIEKHETYKSIIRGKIKININEVHNLNWILKSCNSFGEYNRKQKIDRLHSINNDFKYYYIDHYYFKSTQEFINKINRGDAYKGKSIDMKMAKINLYFHKNKITPQKIDYIENMTKLNLTEYRIKYKSKIIFNKNIRIDTIKNIKRLN